VGESLIIGCDAGANLLVEDPAVSRRHAMMRRRGEGWDVVDLGSANGTFVNGWRVERARLSASDEIAARRHVRADRHLVVLSTGRSP
jgi:pSer/pThr/pTyr-binding forkhead associated (FHA) protein